MCQWRTAIHCAELSYLGLECVTTNGLADLAAPIKSHGGQVVAEYSDGCVHLVSSTAPAYHSHEVYSGDFVRDSVCARKLQSLESYKVQRRESLSDRLTARPGDLIVTCFADCRPRQVANIARLRSKATQMGVLEQFRRLVRKCKQHSSAEVSEVEVLRALLRNHGDVQQTLQDFII